MASRIIAKTPKDVLTFWFKEETRPFWFAKSAEFDQLLHKEFYDTLQKAIKCELYHWRTTPQGRLAEVIVLDQFSRNLFRNTPQAFAQDPMALTLAQEAIHCGDDQKLTQQERGFLYMPYMHSESLEIHDDHGIPLFEKLDNKYQLEYEIKHRDIIAKFGRYPHRNEILGRESTEEEIEFLKTPGSSF